MTGRFNAFTAGREKSSVELAVAVGRRLLGCEHGGRGDQRGSIEVFPEDEEGERERERTID